MPDFNLTESEALHLEGYLRSRVPGPKSDPGVEGDAKRGLRLVAQHGCVLCHALDGVNGSKAPELDLAGDVDWRQRGCVATEAGVRGAAPEFDFAEEEREGLLALKAENLAVERVGDTAAEFADRQFNSLRCWACHGRDGVPDTRSALENREAVAHGGDEEEGAVQGTVHTGRPILTHTGEKLYSGWVRRLLEGSLGYKVRPEVQGRMPRFRREAARFAEGFAHAHGYPAEDAPGVEVDADLAETGRRLTLVDGGFSCVSCHGVGARKALAGEDTATVNFGAVGERLRRSYYWRYVQDPPRVAPGTMMPKFIGEDGRTAIRSVFEGDPERQFEAVWHYLHSIRGRDLPKE